MSDPSNVALYGHRSQLLLLNNTSGSSAVIDRVQLADPSANIRSEGYYELGRKGRFGSTRNPPELRFMFDQNMVNCEADFLLAGKIPNQSIAQQYQIADMLGQDITAYILNRGNNDAILNEMEVNGCVVSEVAYRFSVNGAIMQSFTMVGRGGKLYKAASVVHPSWGALNDTDPGGIHGKDARIWFTSGSAAADRAFRLQSFNIRATFPSVYVRELGRRDNVGTLNDVPEVSVDFELLSADDQPIEKFFNDATTYYDLANRTSLFNAQVRVFHPDFTEAANVIKMFKIENVEAISVTPIRAQVRGLATSRYGLVMSQEATANSGGLIVSNRNDL